MHFKPFGKYTIVKKVGAGGMADIFLSCQLHTKGISRFVIIKKASSKFSKNKDFKDMFENEGKIVCNLKHKNITPIYEFGIEKQQMFIAMEYISGLNLKELVKKMAFHKKTLSIEDIVYIIKEATSGLNYAHNAIDSSTGRPLNLIHRDISPQNLMISFDGEVKLIDFGIAKVSNTNLTRAGHLKGKFSYMSPEQACGDVLDGRTDIFSLGVVLWELLTGVKLFATKNELNTLKKVKACEVPDCQKINPKIPKELALIVKKALSKNKNMRYERASQMEQDLSIFLNRNFPKYSQYDFISLLKGACAKDILIERENLKRYSLEFKKYINLNNIEKDVHVKFETPSPAVKKNSLEMNSISDTGNHKIKMGFEEEDEEETLTRHPGRISPGDKKGKTLSTVARTDFTESSEVDSLVVESEHTKPPKKTPRRAPKKESLILKEESGDHKEKIKVTPKKESKQPEIMGSSAFLQMASNSKTKTTNHTSLTRSSTLYDQSEILKETMQDNKNSNPVGLFLLGVGSFLFILGGIGVGAFLLLKDVDLTSKAPAPTTVRTQPISKATAPQKKIKIFLKSNPSGALIYVNNKKLSSQTPSLISISAEKKATISIKKNGYVGANLQIDPKNLDKNSFNIELKKSRRTPARY